MWFHIITIILLLAQILGYINISLWLVFLPSIIAIALGLFVMLMVVLVAYTASKN